MLTQSELDFNSSELKNENESMDDEEKLQQQQLKPRKYIAKTKTNNRKGYKKKVLEIQPIIYQQLALINKYVLYGSLEIENFYKDYPSPYEKELIDRSEVMGGIVSVQKSIKDSNVTINTYTKSTNCLRQFQFLIDHFAQIPDQNYQLLSNQLSQYQQIVNKFIEHTDSLQMRMKQRLISEEEVTEAFNQYRIKFEEYAKKETSEDEFYVISYSQLNLDLFELESIYSKISFALLSLVGIEPQNCESVILRSTSSYMDQFGFKRLEQAIKTLLIITSQKYEFTMQEEFQTIDKIRFYGTQDVKMFVWNERPEWMKIEDCIGIVVKINIPLAQLKSILQIRSQMCPSKQFEYGLTEDDFCFEYSIQSEIFLEKFYSQLYTKDAQKQSLEIKQELVDKMSEEQRSEQEDKSTQQMNEIN